MTSSAVPEPSRSNEIRGLRGLLLNARQNRAFPKALVNKDKDLLKVKAPVAKKERSDSPPPSDQPAQPSVLGSRTFSDFSAGQTPPASASDPSAKRVKLESGSEGSSSGSSSGSAAASKDGDMRVKVQQWILDALMPTRQKLDKERKSSSGGVDSLSDPQDLARRIEEALFHQFRSVSQEYRAKSRAVPFSLKNNETVTRSLLTGGLSAESFVSMSDQQLANEKQKEERRQAQELAKADARKDVSVEDVLSRNLEGEGDEIDELDLL